MWSCAPRKGNLTESEILMGWTSLHAEHTEPLYYLPSYTATPVLNLTLRLSLTLTLLLQTELHWTTGEQRVTQIVCARHFVQNLVKHSTPTTSPQQTNRISGVWALMSTAVPRYRGPSRPIEWHTYITSPHWRRTRMPGGVYNFQGCASFTDVLDIIQYLYSAIMSYADTEALVAPV